jgi:DNA-binding response OmpR family regulator
MTKAGKPGTKSAEGMRRFGPLPKDALNAQVSREGRGAPLSGKDFQLLRYFVEHPNVTLSREELHREVWDCHVTTRIMDAHVVLLRQKLEPDFKKPQYILTLISFGYRFKV